MSEKSSTQQQQEQRKRSKLSTFLSLLLAFTVFYSILSLISIERRGQASRIKSPEEWKTLLKNHPYHEQRQDTDVRSPCPALNTLANHGLIARDGRNITWDALFDAIVKIGLTPVASEAIIAFVFSKLPLASPNDGFIHQFRTLKHIDLDRLTIYGVLEHDVSLTRNDTALLARHDNATTADISKPYIQRMINMAENNVFTRQNEHDVRKLRWLESLRDNKYLNLRLFDQAASAAECSLLMEILGRKGEISTSHLASFLLEEKFPEDWYPHEINLFSFTKSFITCWYGVRNSKASL